jgi:hypothetical protein
MKGVVIELDQREIMRMEAILMDKDEKDALAFIREVLMPKVRAKGSRELDPHKGTGMPR